MKKPIRNILLAVVLLFGLSSQAQVSVNVNIGAQPLWGPVGYDYVQYYYLPEYDFYYDVPAHRYVYLDGGRWIFAAAPPPRFAHIDFYSTYKVVVNEPKAYLHYKEHKVKYAEYKGGGHQVVIKNSDEPKYYVVKGHPHYSPSPGQMKKAPQGNYKMEGHPGHAPAHGPSPSMGGKEKGPGGGGGPKGGGGKGGGGKGKH